MQTFYLLSGSISLEGLLFLLPKLCKLGFPDKYSGAGGKGSTEALLLRGYLSLQPFISIQLFILAHFKPNIFTSCASLVLLFYICKETYHLLARVSVEKG